MGGKSVQKVGGKSAQPRYTRIPKIVLLDVELTPLARCVYAYLAMWVFQGNVARIGVRRIAKELGAHKESVQIALQALQARSHLTIRGDGKSRRTYILHSDVFAQKQHEPVRTIAMGPSGNMRIVSMPKGAAV